MPFAVVADCVGDWVLFFVGVLLFFGGVVVVLGCWFEHGDRATGVPVERDGGISGVVGVCGVP